MLCARLPEFYTCCLLFLSPSLSLRHGHFSPTRLGSSCMLWRSTLVEPRGHCAAQGSMLLQLDPSFLVETRAPRTFRCHTCHRLSSFAPPLPLSAAFSGVMNLTLQLRCSPEIPKIYFLKEKGNSLFCARVLALIRARRHAPADKSHQL